MKSSCINEERKKYETFFFCYESKARELSLEECKESLIDEYYDDQKHRECWDDYFEGTKDAVGFGRVRACDGRHYKNNNYHYYILNDGYPLYELYLRDPIYTVTKPSHKLYYYICELISHEKVKLSINVVQRRLDKLWKNGFIEKYFPKEFESFRFEPGSKPWIPFTPTGSKCTLGQFLSNNFIPLREFIFNPKYMIVIDRKDGYYGNQIKKLIDAGIMKKPDNYHQYWEE